MLVVLILQIHEFHVKAGTTIEFGFRPDVATMPHRNLLCDGQADAVAGAFIAAMQALEWFEQFRRIDLVESNALVPDR